MKFLIKVVCILLLFGLVGSCFASCVSEDPKTVKLNQYMVIKAEGESGEGKIVKAELNYAALAKDLAARGEDNGFVDEDGKFVYKIKIGAFGQKILNFDVTTALEAAEKAFKEHAPKLIDKTFAQTGEYHEDYETLSNGDVLPFTWEVDEEKLEILEKIFNIEVVYNDFVYMVSNLKETKE